MHPKACVSHPSVAERIANAPRARSEVASLKRCCLPTQRLDVSLGTGMKVRVNLLHLPNSLDADVMPDAPLAACTRLSLTTDIKPIKTCASASLLVVRAHCRNQIQACTVPARDISQKGTDLRSYPLRTCPPSTQKLRPDPSPQRRPELCGRV